MKHLTLTALLSLVSVVWAFARSASPPETVTGPVELHNPHRRTTIGNSANGISLPLAQAAEPIASPPSPVAIYADGRSVFVVRGDSLFKFDKKTLKLLNSAPLPHQSESLKP